VHPNAYLKKVRNVKSGLRARSKILEILEAKPCDAAKIARMGALSYNVVMHHLRLLKNEGIVIRNGRRPYYWAATGLGQKRLQS
jgi:DNA-binding transcriptional ArsR family regulator